MMFKIYFYPSKQHKEDPRLGPDFFFLEGETIEEIREQNRAFFKQRGLDIDEHYGWSQEVKSDI